MSVCLERLLLVSQPLSSHVFAYIVSLVRLGAGGWTGRTSNHARWPAFALATLWWGQFRIEVVHGKARLEQPRGCWKSVS